MKQVNTVPETTHELTNISFVINNFNECTFREADETHEGGSFLITKNPNEDAFVELDETA
ncbi:hypothetical protein [Aliivibrio logei]|uniref:hypothetical protein n=1 Tax=Aliivibrio logei TaxID=688 RepID=UPI0035C88DD6